MRSFASDNNSGVHPAIMEALTRANRDHALGYGDDLWTEEAVRKIKETFVADCEPLFVFNGTGSNVIALQLMTRPYNSILCAETAHIYVDECGSPVKMTGCQIRPIATPDGKLTPQLITPYLHGFADQHHSQPGAIYLSECTELGTIYTPDELKAITSLAYQYGMRVHMDGSAFHTQAIGSVGIQNALSILSVHCLSDRRTVAEKRNPCQCYGKASCRCSGTGSRRTFHSEGGKQPVVPDYAPCRNRSHAANLFLLFLE